LNLVVQSQSAPFLKAIKDSSNLNYFGQIGFVGVDSNYIHLLFNSGFNLGGYCTSGNGSIYYTKVNKQSGSIISTRRISGLYPSRVVAAILKNGFLYLGGETGYFFFNRRAFIFKFNTQTYSFEWQRSFNTTSWIPPVNYNSLYPAHITSLMFNPTMDKLAFFGTGNCFKQGGLLNCAIGSYRGVLDTNNMNFQANCYGNSISDTLYDMEPKFVLAKSGTKAVGLRINNLDKSVSLVSNPNYNQMVNSESTKKLALVSTGNNYVNHLGIKFINVVDATGGTHLLLTDSLNMVTSSTYFSGLHFRDGTCSQGFMNAVFTNDLGNGKADALVNLRIDSLLNVVASKKMYIDTFTVQQFNCKLASDANFNYIIYNKLEYNAYEIQLYKFNFSSYNCNEQPFTPLILAPSISFTNSNRTPSMNSSPQFTITPNTIHHALRDSSFCYNGQSQAPEAGFMVSNVCVGNSVTIINTTTNTPAVFNWALPGTASITSTLFQPTVAYSIPGVYTITLTALNQFGNNTTIGAITVHPLPQLTANSGSICPGQNFTIAPSGAVTYTYFSGGPIVTPIANTTYSILGTDSNGCVSNNYALSMVYLHDVPIISVVSNKTMVCKGEAFTLTASGANTFTWNSTFVGNPYSLSINANSIFVVVGSDLNSCKDSTSIQIKVSSCTHDFESDYEASVKAFPIPCTNELVLEMTKKYINKKLAYQILNSAGLILSSEVVYLNDTKYLINVESFPSGLYFLQFGTYEENSEVIRFTIVR